MRVLNRFFLCCFIFAIALSLGAQNTEKKTAPQIPQEKLSLLTPPDYTNPSNWAVYTAAGKADKPFDVFYVYPTLVADKVHPLMPWDRKMQEKTIPFAKAQLSGLEKHANLYAPYVRQLEFFRIIKQMKAGTIDVNLAHLDETPAIGMLDTIAAFRYYLTHLNRGRPYILLGHSQGAMDLAMVLQTVSEASTDRGFVAAYLIGCPFPHPDKGINGHPFAKGTDDLGVIITWNSQSKDAVKSFFAGKGYACINPLNWKTTAEPASAKENPCSMFYDYKNQTFERIPNYCGALIDLEKGALIVEPPPSKQLDSTLLGKGIYHLNDLYLFYDAMVQNMLFRVNVWQLKYGQAER